MALNEYNASLLGRFHTVLSARRWERDLVAVASGFATSQKIKIGGNGAFDKLYREHLQRVRGKSSPKACDDLFHSLVTGGHSDRTNERSSLPLEGTPVTGLDA